MELKFNFTAQQLIEYENLSEATVDGLARWCETQPIPRPTRELIALCLLACFSNEERTRSNILHYYGIKNEAPGIFNSRNVNNQDVKDVLDMAYFCVMPRRTPDGSAVVCMKAKNKKHAGSGAWNVRGLLKVICMVLESAIFEYPPKNFIIIFDVEHMTLKHLSKMKLKSLKIFLRYLQEGFPCVLKAIHVINMVDILNKTLKMLKPFIKKNVWEMTKFYSKKVDKSRFFREIVGEEFLPEDYGGCLGSIELVDNVTVQKLNALQEFFDAEELHRQCPAVSEVKEDSDSELTDEN